MKIKAVMFDVIGTTVKEKDPNTIINCLVKSFSENGVAADIEFLNRNRGRDKMELIREFVKEKDLSQDHSPLIFDSFKKNFLASIHNFMADRDAEDLFDHLNQLKIKIGLGTGLSKELFQILIEHLKWNIDRFDYIGVSNDALRSRPHPDMIFDMMHKLRISSPAEILKVGDTIADIREGKNAGVFTAAILSGTQSEKDLEKEGPDLMIRTLAELKIIIS